MLSLDRYATVKHPRLAQLRQRRFLPTFLAFVSWITAICVSVPILLESGTYLDSSANSTGLNQTIQISNELTSELLWLWNQFQIKYNYNTKSIFRIESIK